MRICKLTILSSVDGEESKSIRMGKMDISDGRIFLTYREENASVSLTLRHSEAIIDRQGDYSLCLRLIQGQRTNGSIGMGGSEGEVPTQTHEVAYTVEGNILTAKLDYALLFGEEKQEMRLCLTAQTRG